METAARLGSGGRILRQTFSGARTCRRSSRSLGNEGALRDRTDRLATPAFLGKIRDITSYAGDREMHRK
jgi:hypothetical protein